MALRPRPGAPALTPQREKSQSALRLRRPHGPRPRALLGPGRLDHLLRLACSPGPGVGDGPGRVLEGLVPSACEAAIDGSSGALCTSPLPTQAFLDAVRGLPPLCGRWLLSPSGGLWGVGVLGHLGFSSCDAWEQLSLGGTVLLAPCPGRRTLNLLGYQGSQKITFFFFFLKQLESKWHESRLCCRGLGFIPCFSWVLNSAFS